MAGFFVGRAPALRTLRVAALRMPLCKPSDASVCSAASESPRRVRDSAAPDAMWWSTGCAHVTPTRAIARRRSTVLRVHNAVWICGRSNANGMRRMRSCVTRRAPLRRRRQGCLVEANSSGERSAWEGSRSGSASSWRGASNVGASSSLWCEAGHDREPQRAPRCPPNRARAPKPQRRCRPRSLRVPKTENFCDPERPEDEKRKTFAFLSANVPPVDTRY